MKVFIGESLPVALALDLERCFGWEPLGGALNKRIDGQGIPRSRVFHRQGSNAFQLKDVLLDSRDMNILNVVTPV